MFSIAVILHYTVPGDLVVVVFLGSMPVLCVLIAFAMRVKCIHILTWMLKHGDIHKLADRKMTATSSSVSLPPPTTTTKSTAVPVAITTTASLAALAVEDQRSIDDKIVRQTPRLTFF
jgi:hypothetical protein